MSGDAGAIMERLNAMELAHLEALAGLRAEIATMRLALVSCQSRCHVGNEAQIAEALARDGQR